MAAKDPAPAKKAVDDDDDRNPYGVVIDNSKPAEEINFVTLRDRFPKSMRGPAQGNVVVPANWLIAFGVGNCVACMLWFVVGIFPFIFTIDKPITDDEKPMQYWFIGISTFLFFWNSVIIYGAFKMHTIESYGWAMTACIFAILGGALWGMIAGIVGIVKLRKPETIAGFAEKNPYKHLK